MSISAEKLSIRVMNNPNQFMIDSLGKELPESADVSYFACMWTFNSQEVMIEQQREYQFGIAYPGYVMDYDVFKRYSVCVRIHPDCIEVFASP